MTDRRKIIRQEIKANYLDFKYLCRKKRYDDAASLLMGYSLIIDSLSKREMKIMMKTYHEIFVDAVENDGKALDNLIKEIEEKRR